MRQVPGMLLRLKANFHPERVYLPFVLPPREIISTLGGEILLWAAEATIKGAPYRPRRRR